MGQAPIDRSIPAWTWMGRGRRTHALLRFSIPYSPFP